MQNGRCYVSFYLYLSVIIWLLISSFCHVENSCSWFCSVFYWSGIANCVLCDVTRPAMTRSRRRWRRLLMVKWMECWDTLMSRSSQPTSPPPTSAASLMQELASRWTNTLSSLWHGQYWEHCSDNLSLGRMLILILIQYIYRAVCVLTLANLHYLLMSCSWWVFHSGIIIFWNCGAFWW